MMTIRYALGRIFGRIKSTKRENVAVYCDREGYTCISVQSGGRSEPRRTIRMSLNAVRVIRNALDSYLNDVDDNRINERKGV